MTTKSTDKPTTKRPRKMAREPKPQGSEAPQGASEYPVTAPDAAIVLPPRSSKAPTKTVVILGLLSRPEGATLAAMVEATGWLPHTTRAALTGLKKKGHELTSTKTDGIRTYRVISVQQPKATPTDEAENKPAA